MRISDWSSDVCSSDLSLARERVTAAFAERSAAIRIDSVGHPPDGAGRQLQANPMCGSSSPSKITMYSGSTRLPGAFSHGFGCLADRHPLPQKGGEHGDDADGSHINAKRRSEEH